MENLLEYFGLRKVQESSVTIEILNDDCLLTIFQYLPIVDKFSIATVCKKWHDLSQLSWSKLKKLDFQLDTWMSRLEKRTLCQTTFDKVLTLSGKYLVIIEMRLPYSFKEDFIDFQLGVWPIFHNICQSCPNMRELTFLPPSMFAVLEECPYFEDCNDNTHKLVPWLMAHSHRLTKLVITSTDTCDTDEALMMLLARMKNLKSFMVTRRGLIAQNDFFLKLPHLELEEVIFNDVTLDDRRLQLGAISKCAKVRSIGFTNCDMKFGSIDPPYKNLRELRMIGYVCFFRNPERKLLSYVRNLTELEIMQIHSRDIINDEFLEVIAENCKNLSKLSFEDCEQVTDEGILSITSLKKLRFLDLGRLFMAICPPFEKLSNLEVLICRGFVNIKCECFCALIRHAPYLRLLVISPSNNKSFQSTKLLTTAMEVLKTRKSYRILNIKVGMKEQDLHLLNKMPPLLNVLPSYIQKRERTTISNMFSRIVSTFCNFW